ncbi:hypothetical protein AS030_17345 [Fictibacillus enclensis]|uniref:Uncharacterized protein n=1 Tax=Fictibacillus enclensis TaxID=1017270 RepID=A0A0V8J516_9BACL|nr:hypothetical protein AS030_17345 [Fictibacillus enclensis]
MPLFNSHTRLFTILATDWSPPPERFWTTKAQSFFVSLPVEKGNRLNETRALVVNRIFTCWFVFKMDNCLASYFAKRWLQKVFL